MSDSDPEMALSVILCVHDGADRVLAALDALRRQQWDEAWEIVVVDNASRDATAAVVGAVAAEDPRVRLVDAPERPSLSYARNVGAHAARGRALAFVDDDDEVGGGWVAAMGRALTEHQLVASRYDYERLSDPAALVGRSPYQRDHLERFCGVPVVQGAGSGWARSLWDRLGGNDEAFYERVRAGEDTEMALRAVLGEGVDPYFAADAVYHYRRRAGGRAAFSRSRRYARANALLERTVGVTPVKPWRRRWRRHAALAWELLRTAPATWRRDRRTAWCWRAGSLVGELESAVLDGRSG